MFTALTSLISCNSYRIFKKKIDKRMNSAELILKTEMINSDTIEYWDNNSDKPVALLVHGFGASTEYQWHKQVEFLSQNHRVVAPNLFHFGNSRPGTPKFEVRDQVELVNSLVNHLKLDSITLFGVSYGGLVSIEFTQKYSHKVEHLIIFDAPVKYILVEDVYTLCERFKVASVEDLFVPKNLKDLNKLFRLALGKSFFQPNFILKSFYDNMYADNVENKRVLITTLITGLEEYTKHNYDFNIPTLLIWGSTDMAIPVDRAPLIRSHIGSNAELKIIKNGAHMPNITKTKKFNGIVSAFLAQK